jgi:hypothetical protein
MMCNALVPPPMRGSVLPFAIIRILKRWNGTRNASVVAITEKRKMRTSNG